MLLCTALASFTACDSDGDSGSIVSPLPLVEQGSVARDVSTYDDELLRLSQHVPGFAGLRVDSNGIVVLRLTEPGGFGRDPLERMTDAAPHVRDLLPGSLKTADIRVESALHTFADLKAWYDPLVPVLPWDVVSMTDIDEATGRIYVGVVTESAVDQVRRQALESGVPSEALHVEVREPLNVATSLSQLQGAVTPRIPGTQIQYVDVVFRNCTLGYNVELRTGPGGQTDGHRYFVTASHCGDAFGSVTGQSMGQPNLSNPIGVEVLDPPLFTNATNALCPVGRACRYSDASIIRYDAGIAVDLGRIALNTLFSIVRKPVIGESWGHPSGTTVWKTGRTTGTTSGQIQHTCFHAAQYRDNVDTNRTMLCQILAGFGADGGDSGGPVFFSAINPYQDAGLNFVGILWGASPDVSIYSPTNQVLNELSNWTYPWAYPFYSWVRY